MGLNIYENENKMIKACSEKSKSEYHVSVLADRWLQEWSFDGKGENSKREDTEIFKKVREFYQEKIGLRAMWQISNIGFWICRVTREHCSY